jgi:hypothetical protein
LEVRFVIDRFSRLMLIAPTASVLLLSSLTGCATAPAGPSQVWLGQVSQGAPTQTVQLKSWKELKFNDLVRQQTDFSCGAAAMATIFRHAYGKQRPSGRFWST